MMPPIPLCLLALLLFLQSGTAAAPSANDRLDDELVDASGWVPVFVTMDDQLFPKAGDYEEFCDSQPVSADRLEIRAEVVRTLKQKAERALTAVSGDLERLEAGGAIRNLKAYWIVNGFACEATPDGCRALAGLEGVSFVHRQRQHPQHQTTRAVAEPADGQAALFRQLMSDLENLREDDFDPTAVEIPWNLKRLRVDRAWSDHGVTGRGVVVAVLDTGMMPVPSLIPALWRNPNEQLNGRDDDGNGYIDDIFGYDFEENHPYAVAAVRRYHGTMCMGIIAGRATGGARPIVTGVAPRSRIMVLGGKGLFSAYEYALENGADVLSMSHTLDPRNMGHYRGVYRAAFEHLSAAGVLSVGGAGNYGQSRPAGWQVGGPKDIPCVIAAAGIFEDGVVPDFSSRGPVSWKDVRNYDHPGAPAVDLIKPDVTACIGGFPVWTRRASLEAAGRYLEAEVVHQDEAGNQLVVGPRGNSFSGPHAAGIAALMLEANPQLPVWHLKRLMEETCLDLGTPGRDHETGAGLLQADKAVRAARAFGGTTSP